MFLSWRCFVYFLFHYIFLATVLRSKDMLTVWILLLFAFRVQCVFFYLLGIDRFCLKLCPCSLSFLLIVHTCSLSIITAASCFFSVSVFSCWVCQLSHLVFTCCDMFFLICQIHLVSFFFLKFELYSFNFCWVYLEPGQEQ